MFSTFGACLGLLLSIFLIVRKVTPAYALIFGAIVGGVSGGGGLSDTVAAMVSGTQAMMPSVLRILASGVLVGALVKTGSAAKIADAIITRMGFRFALFAIALATMTVTAVGVFIDIAVITVAPVALAIGRRAKVPIPALLLAMVGGGKAGNIISPNPNTIAVAEAFRVDLTALMTANLIPAVVALAATCLIADFLARHWRNCVTEETAEDAGDGCGETVSAGAAIAGPATVILLLALRPLFGIAIDPLLALPAGGIIATVACGKWRKAIAFSEYGLSKVVGVAVLLTSTGTIAGIIRGSGLNGDMIAMLNACHLPVWTLAPISGVLLAGATASTTAGVTIASQTFAETLIGQNVPAIFAACMLHAGGTVLDALPHGSFFHATAGAVGMSVKDRLKLFPFGAAVGLASTVASVAVYLARAAG